EQGETGAEGEDAVEDEAVRLGRGDVDVQGADEQAEPADLDGDGLGRPVPARQRFGLRGRGHCLRGPPKRAGGDVTFILRTRPATGPGRRLAARRGGRYSGHGRRVREGPFMLELQRFLVKERVAVLKTTDAFDIFDPD